MRLERPRFPFLLPVFLLAMTGLLSAPADVRAQADASEAVGGMGWKPARWGLGGSVLWRDKDGSTEFEVELDGLSEWRSPRDQVSVEVRSKYDRSSDKNEQLGRLRWFHDLGARWFLMGAGNLERNTVSVLDLDALDYVLLRGTAGVGVRQAWGARGATRVAAQWNQVHLRLIDLKEGEGVDAPSVFLDTRLALGEQVTLTHWGNVLFWKDGTRGVESEAELSFAVTGNFNVGLRHVFRDNAATLQASHDNELKVFTRLTF